MIQRAMDQHGNDSLVDYLCQAVSIGDDPLQPRNDLLEAVYRYVVPLLGETVAEKAVQELHTLPAVLTAHHHGVDFQAQSVQTSLIFSLRTVGGQSAGTVPVFACGNVSLNNPTYPRGLLLYHPKRQETEFQLPFKLPIFPDRAKRRSVSLVAPYNTEMLAQAKRRLAVMVKKEQIPLELAAAAESILQEDYGDETILGLESYSKQAVVLNNRIFKRCFREPDRAPEMVFLELEQITNLLLQVDLSNEDSLIWQMMFNPAVRARVLNQLDGARACWDRARITQRLLSGLNRSVSNPGNCGTIFFWGVGDDGCRVPLLLTGQTDCTASLQGRDDRGKLWIVPFQPSDILKELRAGRLLPSLFTCYSAIGFARGVSCCGGYFQAHYLSVMQHGLVRALSESPGYVELAARLSQFPSSIYLSGMQAVMRSLDDDLLLPVGPVEMMAGGGLSWDHLDRMRSLTVRDAHLASLTDTLPDILPPEDRSDQWCLRLAQASRCLLKERIVMI
ncbi:MAG: hypothetical protein H6974_02585 [Gammaproteobacteria bacterium]|nr:hypothetical protein [Gammaproteobacteria bacterium]